MSFRSLPVYAALAASTALLAAPISAQDIQYETVSKVEFAGTFGRVVQIAQRLGGGSSEVVQTTFIKGAMMRTDSDQASTITDIEGKRIIVIDHKDKTYAIMTFEDAIAAMQTTAAAMSASDNQARTTGTDAAETAVTFRFAVDRASGTEQIAGYRASRVFLTAEMEGEYTPDGATDRQKGGTLVVLSDMWTSTEIPAFKALSPFEDASAKELANAGSALMEGFAAAFADDPRVKVAFQRSAAEAKKIEGMPVRTVTTFTIVAPGEKFDRDLATAAPTQGPSVAQQAAASGFGRLRAAAGAAAAGASRGALGGGGGGDQQTATADPSAPQATMFTVTSEIRNLSLRPLDAALFAPPSGYREVKQP